MKLCEHLEPIYQNEIANGNEVLSIGIGYDTGLMLCIFFKYPLRTRNILPDLEIGSTNLVHWPTEDWIKCNKCRMMLSFPWAKNNRGNWEPSPFEKEDPSVLASSKTVIVLDETSRTGVKPTIVEQHIKTQKGVFMKKYQCPWCGEYCISAFAKMRLVNPLNTRECPKCRKYIKVKLPWKNWICTLIILLVGLLLSLWIPFHYQFISPIVLSYIIIAIKDIFITVPKLPILKD